MTPKTIVIGAGPAGLSCAAQLVDRGYPVEVFEASPHVGGLARSMNLWGQIVDIGPHRFFSSDRIVNEHWKRFIGNDYVLVNRLTRIYYKNHFFFYPLQPLNAFSNLGPFDVALCVSSYLLKKLKPTPDPKTFEEWVTNRFGERLFRIFFKTYSEKVWGIPCSKIDADWAAQRIKKLSLWEAAKSALFGDRKRRHKTLVDQFAYPTRGTGVLYDRLRAHVERGGGKVHLQSPAREVLLNDEGRACGIRLADGREIQADYVVSTMPLTLMVKSLKSAPQAVREACDELFFRNTILVYLDVDRTDLFPDNWVYVHSPEVQHGRITNFRNWSPELHGDAQSSILCMEFWCFDQDPLWSASDDELGRLAEEELRKIQLLPEGAKILHTHAMKIPRSYPVYQTGYQKPLKVIQEYLNTIPNLLAIGRYGAFKYNNQDHSILMGLLAASEIITGQPQGLWDINTDSEYQESAAVKEVFGAPPAGAQGAATIGSDAGPLESQDPALA